MDNGYGGGLQDVSTLQVKIMVFVSDWAKKQKTSVPKREIIITMKREGVKDFTTINALMALIKKGYIRKACSTTNRVSYVQLRGLNY